MKPIKYGASWKSNASIAANTAQEIIAAAANVRGLYIWGASSISISSGSPVSSFIAKASAPTTIVDGDVLPLGAVYVPYGGASTETLSLDRPIFIPAGKGLYFITAAAQGTALRSVIYDLL